MEGSKTLYCSSKFPWARERDSSKFIDNLSKSPQKGSPALALAISDPHHTWSFEHTDRWFEFICGVLRTPTTRVLGAWVTVLHCATPPPLQPK
jgi:hypothetical protein